MTANEQRAREWLEEIGLYGYVDSEGHVTALAAEFESIAAEERGQAIEECVRAIDCTAPGVDPATHEEAIEIDTVRACVASIRALAPTGLVAVSADSLKAALDIIDASISECGNLSDGLTPDEADAIRPLRAAVARKGG